MPGFANLDALIAAITVDGQQLQRTFRKEASQSPEAAGVLVTLWRDGPNPAAGGDGGAGSGTPGAGGTALTSAAGSLSEGWANTSPATKHIVAIDARSTAAGTLILLDRLVSVSGITLVGTGSKNVNTATLPRYTDGVGVQAFLEVTTVTNTNTVVGTASYTDQGGTNGNTSPTFTFPAAATNVNTLIPIGYASGDYGVRSVETISLSTAAASTGACNLILAKELARLPLESNIGNTRDTLSQVATLPRVYDGASLMLAWAATSTGTVVVDGVIYAAYD